MTPSLTNISFRNKIISKNSWIFRSTHTLESPPPLVTDRSVRRGELKLGRRYLRTRSVTPCSARAVKSQRVPYIPDFYIPDQKKSLERILSLTFQLSFESVFLKFLYCSACTSWSWYCFHEWVWNKWEHCKKRSLYRILKIFPPAAEKSCFFYHLVYKDRYMNTVIFKRKLVKTLEKLVHANWHIALAPKRVLKPYWKCQESIPYKILHRSWYPKKKSTHFFSSKK